MKNCTGRELWEWGSGAIFDLPCPSCGHLVEFFQDEIWRTCGHCRARVRNPRVNACAQMSGAPVPSSSATRPVFTGITSN